MVVVVAVVVVVGDDAVVDAVVEQGEFQCRRPHSWCPAPRSQTTPTPSPLLDSRAVGPAK